ncbi:response regulator transcription factor [Kordiimonas laminariae]|uniref:response regulator transcription factor n=1 Tax=Kordiimonas laminariae TaxID=2917717 RepID=UPI001FF22856|nr:response regulator transcription factor [Kordiimonas laminariae]MCK0067939.1 response regulator transcription factor [Kordiimonas laminariae]
MKALIVDSEEIFRLSLREVVAVSASFTDIIEAGSEHEFLAKTAAHTDLSLIILHPDSLSKQGEDWVKLIRRLYPGIAIVTVANDTHVPESRWMGTLTVPRTASVNTMITTVRRAMRLPTDSTAGHYGKVKAPNLHATSSNDFSRFQENIPATTANEGVDLNRLSYRQKQILAMAADGLPNKEIAARLNIAEGTVKAHMHSIFKVLGVSNRTQAVIRYGASGKPMGPNGTPSPEYRASAI